MLTRLRWLNKLQLAFLAVAWFISSACPSLAVDETLVASNMVCRYLVPADNALGTNWTARAFDDSSWAIGRSGLGYDNATTYATFFGTTVPNNAIAIYTRYAFEVPSGKSYSTLTLKVNYDDGFIATLNGVEVARVNASADATYNTYASAGHADNLAVNFQDFDISSFVSRLMTGTNVLTVHALNLSSSSDFLIRPMLVAGLPEVVTNIVINEFMALNDSTRKNSLGKYEDWVELYNPNSSSVSLSGWYLTDNATKPTKWQFPVSSASTIAAKGYLLVWTDDTSHSVTNGELHASFSLKGEGEYLGLVRPDGTTVVSDYAPSFPAQYDDISYGIGLTGEPRYFATPTPVAVNAFSGGSNQVEGVKFSPKRGVYTNIMPQVTATALMAGSEIRYTTDAEPPTAASTLYTAPLSLAHTAVIRAAAFKSGFAPSVIDTHSFISADDVLRQTGTPAGYPTNAWISSGSTNVPDYAMDQTVVSAYGASLTNALKALPSLSLVTSVSNLFDPVNGIYTHPGSTGTAWEREASAEWIDPDNTSKFQVGCGLQIQGGAFRSFFYSNKKSFALQFRGVYGETSLDERLFSDSGSTVLSYDDLVLRAGANDAWNKWGTNPYKKQYIVDEFMRRTHQAMGGISPHGRFVHLYLNGLYWGIYNVTEKVSGELAAAYCGGQEDTWDVRSQDGALDGDFVAWNAMVKLLSTNGVSNELYQRVQGCNEDGTRNTAYPIYLDVQNYIDYLVVQYWSANSDWPWNNWRAFRDRIDSVSTGFKFAIWDCEAGVGVWGDLTTDVTGDGRGVAVIHSNLVSNAEYRLHFADRIQKHMFNDGELTAEKTVPRYLALANHIEPALVAESARWSDQNGSAARTVAQWRTQRDYVLGTFLTQRGAKALQFFRARGLYPTNDAPTFSPFGGAFSNSLNLAMTAVQPIFYTTDGSDPREYGTGAVLGTRYTNGVALTRTTRIKARARTEAGEWSALTEAVFTLAEKPALRVSELMYHPGAPISVNGESYLDGDDEFIELQNAGAVPVGLAGLHFTQGVAFDFTDCTVQTLEPGAFVLVVKDLSAFTNRYPSVPLQRIAGTFTFPSASLDNAGETIEIQDALGRTVVSFSYKDGWLISADGAGHSLIPLPGSVQTDNELDYPGNWKASVYIGGSPGQAEPDELEPSLVLNEILAHTDYSTPPYDSNDGIELYNASAQPVVLGPGWYLSDDPGNLTKWAIPATNAIAAHGWRYFDEVHDFHAPITDGFGLNKAGDQVLLSYLPGAGQDRVVDAISFTGEENGLPLVRFPDGAASWFYGVLTPGASNRLAEAGVVISEVMYHPKPTEANPENNENDEFVELFNPTAQPVTLMNLVEDVGVWRLAGGIDYLFPSNTVLPAGGRLVVVSFDPASDETARGTFLAAYGLTNGEARLLGPYDGHLNNKTDAVRLERPVNPDVSGEEVSWHVVDHVTYSDDGLWSAEADGTGRPLVRLPGQNSGDDPASWVAGFAATPGRRPMKVFVTAPVKDTGYHAPVSVAVTAAVDAAFVAGAVRQIVFAVDGVDAATVSAAPYTAAVVLDSREGVRRLTARLTDDEGDDLSAPVSVTAYTNVPTLTVTANKVINRTVTDHVGLHASAVVQSGMTSAVSFAWSCPGNSSVTVEHPTQADAVAHFTQPGQYELRVTMYYGLFATNYFVTVTVSDTNTLNRVPYRDSFESYEAGSSLIGIGGWYGASADAAVVEPSTYASAGPGGYPIAGGHEQSLFFSDCVSNRFEYAHTLTNVCVDMLVAFPQGGEDVPELPRETQVAFWIDSNRRCLMVWHGQPGSTNRWTDLTDVVLNSNECVRLTVQADYTRDQQGSFAFRIWVNRVPVTHPAVWFATANTNRNYFSSIAMSGVGQVDDLVVDAYNSMLYRRITAAAGPHGQVVPAGEVLVPVGASTNISVRPDRFYGVGAVAVDGLSVGRVLDYAFTNVRDEHALQADFLANVTGSGVPEVWLNRLNPAWTDNFAIHEREDSDGDGANNAQEYVAGTDAALSQSVFRLDLGTGGGMAEVSFPTVPFSGIDGLNSLRRYALEESDDLAAGLWQGVAGLTNVPGWGQSVTYTNRLEGTARRFYRGRVWLEP